MPKKLFKIALITGGPSLERGISLNSARSVLDHLGSEDIEIIPFYFNPMGKPYKVSKAGLYSNTPSDFDFKLKQNSKPLSTESFIKELKKCDIAFPVIHGKFGEDGEIQKIFTKNKIPFIGSDTKACQNAYNKFYTNNSLKEKGFYTLPSILLKKNEKDINTKIVEFFKENKIKRAIVKPATGGSSIGVYSVETIKDAYEKAKLIFKDKIDDAVVIEPFAEGREFTVIVLENKDGNGVSLIPTEIETSYKDGAIFDFRKKYLPSDGTIYHALPRFTDEQIKNIQNRAEKIFKEFKMNDFVRIDGWLLNNGQIWFSDINPISGMEQNSFYFQQGSKIGFSHKNILYFILKNACYRQNIKLPKQKNITNKRKIVHVLFGGGNSERQVSLMSGTNVWLKLRKSKIYEPKPFLLDKDMNVWELPYVMILNHTVEEILINIQGSDKFFFKIEKLKEEILNKLKIKKENLIEPFFAPKKYSLKEFVKISPFIFLGLHGSPGEDGTIQKILEENNVKYNGPNSIVSKLCMDKYNTGSAIRNLKIKGVFTANQKIVNIENKIDLKKLWVNLLKELNAKTLIVKPRADGCSSGIVRLTNENDFIKYIKLAKIGLKTIPKGYFKNQKEIIEMPTLKVSELMFENFIETDILKVKDLKLEYKKKTGWLEITVGIYTKNKKNYIMNPSLTVADEEVLSLEEKFQGGTGVNITPPPENIINKRILNIIKNRILQVANGIGIIGYSRIDAFVNIKTGEVSIIEINTLPGLTPSTVIYHQALAEKPPMHPTEFLELLIKNKNY